MPPKSCFFILIPKNIKNQEQLLNKMAENPIQEPDQIAREFLDDIITGQGLDPTKVYQTIKLLQDFPELVRVRPVLETAGSKSVIAIRAEFSQDQEINPWDELQSTLFYQRVYQKTGLSFQDVLVKGREYVAKVLLPEEKTIDFYVY